LNIFIWGYAYEGTKLYRELVKSSRYKVIGFADNSVKKQGMRINGNKILSLEELCSLKEEQDFSVIIASSKWYIIGQQLEKAEIKIEGIYREGQIQPYEVMKFDKLDLNTDIIFYAGDIGDDIHMQQDNLYGLSINKADRKHILHDITEKYPLPDNCIKSYQAEDVLEHIDFEKVVPSINEIYRILKPGGLFRICLPDYYSPWLREISMMDESDNILFDATGGGTYGIEGVENGGHVWFPNFNNVKAILKQTKFNNIEFCCYHTEDGKLQMKEIDMSKGYVKRISKKNEVGIYSMVIDCYK
jgi:SAM-dependent methyltransferase